MSRSKQNDVNALSRTSNVLALERLIASAFSSFIESIIIESCARARNVNGFVCSSTYTLKLLAAYRRKEFTRRR